MKTNILFLIVAVLYSCTPDAPNVSLLSPEEEKLVGTWKEYLPKSPFYDANGVLIDSIDLNSTMVFNNDYTYTTENDTYFGSPEGTWSTDSVTQYLHLIPTNSHNPNIKNHYWAIVTLTADTLNVEHYYEFTFSVPPHTTLVNEYRKFLRVH